MKSKPPIKVSRKIRFKITDSGCHECISHRVNKYDGYFSYCKDNRVYRMHRYIYIQNFGEIPNGLLVRHKCDNRKCINIDHLELGTHKDNHDDCVNRGRKPKGENCVTAKITELQAMEIISIGVNVNYHHLSKIYGISPATIRDIVLRKTWKHLG